jgi:hypothetical protein
VRSIPGGLSELSSSAFAETPTLTAWIDEQTQRIGRIELHMVFDSDGRSELTFTGDLDRYNDDSPFPDEPVDAPIYEGF